MVLTCAMYAATVLGSSRAERISSASDAPNTSSIMTCPCLGSTSAEADVVHDDEYESMYDGATVVGAAEDGDARTLPPSVDDLEEQWQAMHGQLWRASR